MICLATATGVVAGDPTQRERNDAIVKAFNANGGRAAWHGPAVASEDQTEVMVWNHDGTPRRESRLTPLFQLQGISKLLVYNFYTQDSDLDGIDQMQDLPGLLIRGQITDDGLRHLSNAKSLRRLWIYETKVRGHGLSHLQDLDQLELLWIDGQLSDEGIAELKRMTHLKQLHVDDVGNKVGEILEQALPNTEVTY